MNLWLTAAVGLLPPLAAAGWSVATADLPKRVVALEFAGTITAFALMLLAIGYGQASFIDLALALVFLSFPGALAYIHFVERWL